jgi:hypothetical protein
VTLDRVAIALRPRGGYEAIDLGARMLQAWWRPIYAAWFAVYLPFALAVHGALWEYPFAAFAVLFWLKPLFDRFVLHVVSRAVFGDVPTLAATLSAWREILGPAWSRASPGGAGSTTRARSRCRCSSSKDSAARAGARAAASSASACAATPCG